MTLANEPKKYDWSWAMVYVAYFDPKSPWWNRGFSIFWTQLIQRLSPRIVEHAFLLETDRNGEEHKRLAGDTRWENEDSGVVLRERNKRSGWQFCSVSSNIQDSDPRYLFDHEILLSECYSIEIAGYADRKCRRAGEPLLELSLGEEFTPRGKYWSLRLRVPRDCAMQLGRPGRRETAIELFSLLGGDDGACHSGFIDYARGEEIDIGGHYGDTSDWSIVPSFPRLLEKAKWNSVEDRAFSMLRGLFWGNYIGPDLVRKGQLTDLADEYKAYCEKYGYEDETPIVHKYDDGGIFLSLTPDCRMIEKDELVMVMSCYTDRAAWLYRRLAQGGLLW